MIAQYDGSKLQTFANLTDVTMESWVKPVPVSQQHNPDKGCCWPVFGTHDSDDSEKPHVSMGFADQQSLQFFTKHTNSSDVCTGSYLNKSPPGSYKIAWDGQWHHIAASFSSATLTKSWYLDGVLVYSMKCNSPLILAGGSVYVGTTVESNPKTYWEGEIDEVRLWRIARTQAQIQQSMKRTLTQAETASTVFYYNFDNYNAATKPFALPDLGPLGLELSLGKTTEMKFAQDRLTPKFLGSTAPVKGSHVIIDVNRATNKFNGTYTINTWADESTSLLGAMVTLSSVVPPDYGVVLQSGGLTAASGAASFSFPANQPLTIVAKENSNYGFTDGRISIPVTLSSSQFAPVGFNITINVKTPKPINPGSGGSALFCDGRRHGLAKDFSFGATIAVPKYTVEFWAYQFYILPVVYTATAFSIGNSEISVPNDSNWCLQQPSLTVPNSTFCRGRLLMDVPSPQGWLDAYSGWNPGAGTGLTGTKVDMKFGTWYHIAMTGDGTNLTVYINGEVATRVADYGFIPNPTNTPLGLIMCSWPFWGGLEHNYKGLMDEFRIWNVSRTQQQIKSTMHSSIADPGLYPELLTYYNFDELSVNNDANVTATVKVAKDLGRLKSDLVFGGCVPNKAPYCQSTTGKCSAKDLPRVPCYTDTDEALPDFMPIEVASAAPISGYSPSYLASGGVNVTIKLSSSLDGGAGNPLYPVTYTIKKIPDSSNGILLASDGSVLTEGSKTSNPNLLFVPLAGRGGNPLDTISFTTESEFYASTAISSVKISVLCPAGTFLSNGNCQACPEGQYNLQQSFADSCTPYKNLTFSNGTGVLLTIVNAICATVTLLITLAVLFYSKHKVITAASPMFCYLILFGCLLGHVVVFTFPALPTKKICYTQPILEVFAYTLVLSNIGIKTFRIHRIFNTLKVAKSDILIKNYMLLGFAFTFLLIDAIILAAWLAVDPPNAMEISNANGDLFIGCASNPTTAQTKYVTALVVYQILITFGTLYLGMKVRYITSSSFNESKYIVLCIYTISVISIILIPMVYLGDSITYMIRQLFAGIIAAFLCSSTAVILFGPKLALIWQGNAGSIFTSFNSSQQGDDATKASQSQSRASAHNRSISVQSAVVESSDGFLFLEDVHIKAKSKFSWDHVEIVIIASQRSLIARNCNQSVATHYDLKKGNPAVVSTTDTESIVSFNVNGQIYLIKVAQKPRFELLVSALNSMCKKSDKKDKDEKA
ncbi:hypothetical protein HDU97_000750 [Phlyctochytrium planicorne]|nr:hypothetical protein HDU97_000750 [Phlyctochytrium planicorne]